MGVPGRALNRPGPMRSMEQGSRGAPLTCAISSGVRSSHAARPNMRDRHAVLAEMPIDEHGDDAVVRQASANLQRGVERLSNLDRFRAELFPDLQPDPVDRRVRLRHRDNREGQIERASNQQAADFPIPVVPGDEDDPPSPRQEALEHLPVFVDDVEELAGIAVRGSQRAQKIDRVAGVTPEGVQGAPLQ